MTLSTLAGQVRHEQEIRRSRFLAHAAPVASAEEAAAFIARVGASDATHNCWAWRVGGQYRSSDDGEPAGTAGRPILAAIDGQGCDRVAVVVTRWYGGTKLGAGGLARAYGGTAAECLRLAPRIELLDLARVELEVGYAELATLKARLPEHAASIVDERFDALGVALALEVAVAHVDALRDWHRDLTRGAGRFEVDAAA
ncbi:YigZ family protein [Coralloluteibacterium stylophorae]|uniref:IMPACT family protein n=1 Tax=Coralloluteibacterium stylophorae TaxID=1776034 RepID=UPI003083FAE6